MSISIRTNMSTKLMTSRTHSATFRSPDSEDGRAGLGGSKGWCSERVPLASYRARRQVAASALMPFSSGRALPSKWDDAERWISSPVSVGNTNSYYYATGVTTTSSHLIHHHPPQRRAKSKSGPLGPAGLVSYDSFNTYSPVLGMGVANGGNWRNSVAMDPPASIRAPLDHEIALNGEEGGRNSWPAGPDWLDLWSGPPSPSLKANSGDENNENHISYSGGIEGGISRRDMATEVLEEGEISNSHSPSSVANSSLKSWISASSPHTRNNVEESLESEVRDVQVDKQTSTTRRSTDRAEFIHNPSNSFLINTDHKNLKLQKEEARLIAWENLQKAKAEAAIHKLEMKLEKKRSSSMEKIIQKLNRSEAKAQKMRSSLSKDDNEQDQIPAVVGTASKLHSFCRKIRLSSSARSCFTCYPF